MEHLIKYKIKYIEFFIGTFLFITAMVMVANDRVEPQHMSMAIFVGLMMYYLIFLEISRTVVEFIVEDRIKMKYLIDSGIIFVLREILVTTSIHHSHIDKEVLYIFIMVSIFIVLIAFRYLDINLNLKEKNCDSLLREKKNS